MQYAWIVAEEVDLHWRVCARAISLCDRGRELEGGGAILDYGTGN